MPTFVLMTKLAPESLHDAKGRRAMGKEWLQKVRQACPDVKFLAHYALLGPYDSMDIYEAPDVETAHKVSVITGGPGTGKTSVALALAATLTTAGRTRTGPPSAGARITSRYSPASSSCSQKSRPSCIVILPPVRRTTSILVSVLIFSNALSALTLRGVLRPPRGASSAVMTTLASVFPFSFTRSSLM